MFSESMRWIEKNLIEDLFFKNVVKIFLGSLALAFFAQFKIPLYPTPVTLQPLGVFLLGYLLGSKKAFIASIVYLMEATLGLPVLSGGHSNPLWIFSMNAGFLLGFPITAFLAGLIFERSYKRHFLTLLLNLSIAQGLMDLSGMIILSYYVGIHKAFALGVMPFLISNFFQRSIVGYMFYKKRGT